MSILLTTVNTITVSELSDTDGSGATFTHPIVNEDLLDNWDLEDLRRATSLQTAIDAGDVVLTYNDAVVGNLSNLGISLGRVFRTPRIITGSETIGYDDDIVVYRGTGTTDTVTLPSAAGRTGETLIVKNQSANDITVASLGGTIDGFTSVTIQGVLLSAIEFVSDGTDWIAV